MKALIWVTDSRELVIRCKMGKIGQKANYAKTSLSGHMAGDIVAGNVMAGNIVAGKVVAGNTVAGNVVAGNILKCNCLLVL